jgi:dolichol-phosphate mannosyltransferase
MTPRFTSHSSERPIELAVVIPTYNERENVTSLTAALTKVLGETEWEVIFVDDNSPDGTAEHIRGIAATDRRVRVLERLGRVGLSSACIEGMLATPAPYIAVMDADFQHDERVLPEMLARIRSGNLDLVVASRNIAGGSMGGFSPERVWLSRLGTRVSRLVCHCSVSDPMSGFFVVRRAFVQLVLHRLTGTGFKILVDLLASSPHPVRLDEVPYQFRSRQWGQSKLDLSVELEYIYLLVGKVIGDRVLTRFVLFVLVGSMGLLIHFSILVLLYHGARLDFVTAQIGATIAAMTFNFFLNNVITFRACRLRGWRLATGLLTFYLACSLGALINVGFAELLLRSAVRWYVAGICGMAISSVWNYGVNKFLTWRRRKSSVAWN